jgi:hypothetical protein
MSSGFTRYWRRRACARTESLHEHLSSGHKRPPNTLGAVELDPPNGVPEAELNRLYRGPLEGFTEGRNALAKSLRSDGETAAADWVKALKKPTRAAWLVNQLAARKKGAVGKLLDAGAELRRRQEQMMAGSADRDALRRAAAREQQAIDSLLRTAEALGREHKAGSQILDRVGETLQAASSDPEVGRAIELGRLDRERRGIGLGLVGPAAPAPAKGKKGKAKDKQAAERKTREQEAKRHKEAERKVATLEKTLQRRRTAVENARDTLEEREAWYREAVQDLKAAKRELDKL